MFQKREIIPKSNVCNRIDKDVQRIAYSFNFILGMFCSSIYFVQKNRIYPKGYKYILISFCFTLFMSILSIYRMITINLTDRIMKRTENDFMILLGALYYVFYTIGFPMLFILDIVHKYNNVFLILNIQAIRKSIDFSKNIKSFVTGTWISVLATVCGDICIYTSFCVMYDNTSFVEISLDIFSDVMFITFDVNYVVAIRIIILLKHYLDEWIKHVLISDGLENDEQCLELLRTYQNILKAFDLNKEIYQLLTLSHVLDAFYRSILFVYMAIFTLKRFALSGTSVPPLMLVVSFVWLSKNVVLVVIHSIHCERFYITVEGAETACIQLMKNKNCPKCQIHLGKNVLQTNRSFSKMSAYGLFYVDATLPMCLMGVITNYAVVLLQFTLL